MNCDTSKTSSQPQSSKCPFRKETDRQGREQREERSDYQSFVSVLAERAPENSLDVAKVSVAEMRGADDNVITLHGAAAASTTPAAASMHPAPAAAARRGRGRWARDPEGRRTPPGSHALQTRAHYTPVLSAPGLPRLRMLAALSLSAGSSLNSPWGSAGWGAGRAGGQAGRSGAGVSARAAAERSRAAGAARAAAAAAAVTAAAAASPAFGARTRSCCCWQA